MDNNNIDLEVNKSNIEENRKVLFICTVCGTNCSNKQNMNRHMKNIHDNLGKTSRHPDGGNYSCPLCSYRSNLSTQIVTHVEEEHNREIEKRIMKFENFEEFVKWKTVFENENKCHYVIARSKKTANKKYMYYFCHRSGFYKPNLKTGKRQRQLKMRGSNKMNSTCTSHITATILLKTNRVKVTHILTHIGHDNEIGKLRMVEADHQKIAAKLFQGVPNHRILKDIGLNFDSNSRFSYTTNKDINNVKRAYNVQFQEIFDRDDAKSIDILVKKFQESIENPILSYKPYGVEDDEGIILRNNFFLVFFNKAQEELLKKYGNNILMIDSTHGTNSYNIQLSTLMVLDNDYEGFPVAFMWSITQNEQVYKYFFTLLKKKIPDIKPKVFMTDDCNVFYNAFIKVYDCSPKKLLCDWHVKKNLFQNLNKIPQMEKRKEIKHKLFALINELDEATFTILLSSLLDYLLSDYDTQKYYKYFTTFYVKRKEEWAHCFRKGLHRNTNMSLEKWHQEIKHNSRIKGKCQSRLDLSISNVIECLRMKFMKRLVSLSRNKVPYKLHTLRQRHKVATEMLNYGPVQVFEEIPNSQWQIESSKNNRENQVLLEYYSVKVLQESNNCKCNFFCNECSMCLHGMSCTCHDYQIQFNMCKHIHIICSMFLRARIGCNETEIDDSNINQTEFDVISSQLSAGIEHKDAATPNKKLAMEEINKLSKKLSETDDWDQILYITKNVSTINAGVDALQKSKSVLISHNKLPANKKAPQQCRISLPSLQKKRKRENPSSAPSQNNEDLTILNMVMPK